MSKKKIFTLSILIIFQLSVIATMFIKAGAIRSYAKKNDTIIRIRCTAYDPFHPIKGRYIQLSLDTDDIKAAEDRLNLKFSDIQKTANAYYLQEEYALIIDSMKREDFNSLEPVLELYVGKDGTVIQKELYVHYKGAELPVEKYIKDYAL